MTRRNSSSKRKKDIVTKEIIDQFEEKKKVLLWAVLGGGQVPGRRGMLREKEMSFSVHCWAPQEGKRKDLRGGKKEFLGRAGMGKKGGFIMGKVLKTPVN